ncbi:MAG: bacteriohemerythrin [Sulfurimonadaceae bacterium]
MISNDGIVYFEIFPWNKNFEIGIELIDEQHRQLVLILNRLAAHLANRSDEIILNEIFDELADYADYHFKTEETIWSAHFKDDDWFTNHEATHGSFIHKVIALKNNDSNKPLDDVIHDIVSFLSKWLAYHILDTDKRMAKAVHALESGASIEEAKMQANDEMSGSMKVLINTVLDMYDNLSNRTLDLMREKALRKQAEEALSRSEERWKFILDGAVENVWDWDIEHGQMSHSEDEAPLFEIVANSLKTDHQAASIHPADIEGLKADFQAHLDGKTAFYTNKHRVLRKNGSWSWILTRGKVVSRDNNGKALRMVGTHSDITERELAAQIYRNSSQAILISDINNNIISVNPAFTKITGYSGEYAIGKNPKFLTSGKHDRTFFNEMWESIKSTGHWSGEIYNKRSNGEIYPEILMINTVKDTNGHVDHYFALFDDITEKKKADELILEQANYDPLTKLPNRRMFQDRLQYEITRSHRSKLPFALLFIDLDHFKEVNDSLGHEMGDMLLIEAAQRILNKIRDSDTVSHLGGDEFTIIVTEIKDILSIDRIMQDIIKSLSTPFHLDTNQIYVSASIGITLYPADANNASELLKNADQAKHLAKKSGRSCFSYFTPSMQEEAQKRQLLINDLHNASALNQFQVYYQPIIDLKTGKIQKAEALIRWNHPLEGLVSPDNFIPLAEESGLIIEIGDWVYKEATRQTKIWQEQYDPEFQISVNKSPVQFRSAAKIDDWIDHLAELGLSGKSSVIEITESILMEHESRITDKLLQLRDAGIEVSLDDFGTGYSSLSYLKKFDIDYIKIDKSFVSNLTPDSQDSALCEAIIVMAHKLDISVIAEGIETEAQSRLLTDMHCDYGQGYLFSRPVSAKDFEELLTR